MFVRIAWHKPIASTANPRNLRRFTPIARRSYDDLGVPARDFDKMTKSLFDRQG